MRTTLLHTDATSKCYEAADEASTLDTECLSSSYILQREDAAERRKELSLSSDCNWWDAGCNFADVGSAMKAELPHTVQI